MSVGTTEVHSLNTKSWSQRKANSTAKQLWDVREGQPPIISELFTFLGAPEVLSKQTFGP